MFSPPWTVECDTKHSSKNILALIRELQGEESRQHTANAVGGSAIGERRSSRRLRRRRNETTDGRERGSILELRHDHPSREHGQHAASPLEGKISGILASPAALESSPLSSSLHNDQIARDSRLAHPKHRPKFSAAALEWSRLFGNEPLLPLQSHARAQARSKATALARSRISFGTSRIENATRVRPENFGNEHAERIGMHLTGKDGVRRTAWAERCSVVQDARHVTQTRRRRQDTLPPTPESESQENGESWRDREWSEDSVSTEALLYDRGAPRGEGRLSAVGESPEPRKPPGAVGEYCDYHYDESRAIFFKKFREVSNTRQTNCVMNVAALEEEVGSATSRRSSHDEFTVSPFEEAMVKYLGQLIDHGRAPWPALLRLSPTTKALEVGGMGLGDDLAVSLAAVMPILRSVERLVAFDNRMTDCSVFRVVKAVQRMPRLTFLDLSENEFGTSAAHELREYTRSKQCRLTSLILRKANIDDEECREFMAALESNISLVEVDLTENLIGTAETQKETGGHSIARMLAVNSTLTSLNLGWNSLRMASAATVADSLRDNHTLLNLGLAHNSFSDFGSQVIFRMTHILHLSKSALVYTPVRKRLAVALSQNDTLTGLDLSYNSVTPAAAMVLAFALKMNTTMRVVQLEGNRIGQNGGEALVMAMRMASRRKGGLIVRVENCDTSHKDETLFNAADATGDYTLDLQIPYHRVVASELLRLGNCKPTAHFQTLKHVVGKKIVNIKLHREDKAVPTRRPHADAAKRVKQCLALGGVIGLGLFTEFTVPMGMRPDTDTSILLMQKWNEIISREMAMANAGVPVPFTAEADGGDFLTNSFFKALFQFADEDGKGELIVDNLETLFHALGLPHGDARLRHVMTKYDADHSGSIDPDEFIHYMTTSHVKRPFVEHGVLCTEDRKEWQVPSFGTLLVAFVEEPNAHRTLGEMSTDCGVEGLVTNIRQLPNDDKRRRLFELATSNSGTYFSASQAQGLLESVASSYSITEAVIMLMPQLASAQECTTFVDSNLDHKDKFRLRFAMGGAWGAMMGMPSAHYTLDMQSAKDRLIASKMAALANHERQHSKFEARVNTSQHGNWQNFRNAEYNRQPLLLTPGWFIRMPKYGVLRFDYVSTSTPDRHQIPLPEKRFQRILVKLGISTPITSATRTDGEVIAEDALHEACTSHWRRMSSSSSLYKIDMRDYFRRMQQKEITQFLRQSCTSQKQRVQRRLACGSSLDDVSLASWWSAVEVTSVEMDRKTSLAYHSPSDTYVKAWYKLRELEVTLCSACLTTDQVARIVENFPREYQIRAEVVTTLYHKVSDIDQMCLLVDALRPDESREVYTRRGLLNVVNPLFADRYYRLDLSVWDEREMSKFLIRLAMMEPGENWIDETYERKKELGPLPGWELPLDWTTPDVTAEKKDGGPRRFGILTLWYASSLRLGCTPNVAVRQDLASKTLCSRVGNGLRLGNVKKGTDSEFDVVQYTSQQQRRFGGMVDKARQKETLLVEEVASAFVRQEESTSVADCGREENASRHTMASSITDVS